MKQLMKKRRIIHSVIIVLLMLSCGQGKAQKPENWTAGQLMAPADLATTLQSKKDIPVIYNVGPGAIIPHSIDIGITSEEENLERFKKAISKLPKTTNIVVYCGCCPYDHCPNVRPAIDVLQKMKFINYHLLDLPHNIKTDWIAKGYPVTKEEK